MRRRLLLGGLGTVVVLAAAVTAAGGNIELPGWANLPWVDVPFIGDTDVLDCRLSNPEGLTVRLELVDGDESVHPDYEHVWWNGNLVDPELVTRLDVGVFTVEARPGEQFFALSTIPERDDRVFCESIELG